MNMLVIFTKNKIKYFQSTTFKSIYVCIFAKLLALMSRNIAKKLLELFRLKPSSLGDSCANCDVLYFDKI